MAAVDWIDRQAANPFYLLAYTIESHHPYVALNPGRDFKVGDEEFNRYLNSLVTADENIAWFVQQLKSRGLDESTLVVVTADHGESFGQHGQRVHSFGVYEPNVHVPLVFLHPYLAAAPKHSAEVRQHIDLAPTLLEVLGIPAPPLWQGRSLLEENDDSRAYFFSVGNEVVLGLRDGIYKYHYYVDSGQQELFNLGLDPSEASNLAEEQSERCQGYRRKVAGLVNYQRQFLSKHGAP
jgi:arylsulfatase A-like enzyme